MTKCILVCLMILLSCTGMRDEDAPYSAGYDNASLVTIEQGDGYHDLQFPVNQVIVYTEDGVSREDVVELFDSMPDVKIIGQAPVSNFYQIEVKASTMEELNQIMDSLVALEAIKGATYNMLMKRSSDVDSCPVQPDVALPSVEREDRLPYYNTQYLTALEIMQGVRDHITLHPITVGIIEGGYDDNHEFDEITIVNVSEQDERGRQLPLDNTDDHGTNVAGIICGDNDGGGINGLASTLIGEQLRVVMARHRYDITMSVITATESAIRGGARIINTSWSTDVYRDPESRVARETILAFTQLLNSYPDVLFVNSAGNEGKPLTGNNQGPGGIQAPNSLTVSSWQYNNPATRYPGSNYGDVVDISALGENVRMVFAGGLIYYANGTSFSTPMVVSAAAMLKSVDNTLSPGDIKILLTNPTFHASRTEPGGGIQLSFSHPLVDLLWDMYQDTDWGQKLLAGPDGDEHAPPPIVVTRICEDTRVQVDEYGDFIMNEYAACPPGVTMIMAPDGSTWTVGVSFLTNLPGDWLGLGTTNTGTHAFKLKTLYTIEPETVGMDISSAHLIDEFCYAADPEDGDFVAKASCTDGTYEFINCHISERTTDGRPKYLSVDIKIQGTFKGAHTTFFPSNPDFPIDIVEMTTYLSGSLNNVRVSTVDPFGVFEQSVEDVCTSEAEEE